MPKARILIVEDDVLIAMTMRTRPIWPFSMSA